MQFPFLDTIPQQEEEMNCCGTPMLSDERFSEYKIRNQEHKTKYEHPQLEINNRSCRDVWIIPFYVIMWAGMIVIAVFAIGYTGVNTQRLIYGDDYLGNVCGANNLLNPVIVAGLASRDVAEQATDFTNYPYQYFMYPFNDSTDPNVIYAKPRVCVASCPDYTSALEKDLMCLYPEMTAPGIALVAQGECFLRYATIPVFNRCFPQIVILNHSSTAITAINNRDVSETIFASVYTSFNALLGCLAGAFALAFLWLILIRFFASVAVWTTVFSAALLLGTLTALLLFTADSLRSNLEDITPVEFIYIDYVNYNFFVVFGLVAAVITISTLLVIIFNGKNILLSVTLLEECSKAIRSLPFLMVTPFVPFFFLAGFFVYFLEVIMYLGAATIPLYDGNGNLTGYDYNNALKGAVILHILGFLWTCNFIIAILRVTVIGAVTDWYYTGKEVEGLVVLRSFWRAFRYSFGSQLLGSMILPLTEIPRAFLTFLQFLTRDESGRLFKMCSCCLGCFQNQVEFINSHAYLMIGIYGYGFREAAQKGYYVVQSNAIRVGAISCITDTILWLGKLSIVAITTSAGIIYLDISDDTRFWVFPVLFLVIASYFVACCFMDIYVAAALTLVFCFLEDYERNTVNDRHMSKSLEAFLTDPRKKQICQLC